MKARIVAIGVIIAVIGIFLFITGYQRIASIPEYMKLYSSYNYLYQNELNLGQLLEILGGILTALGLGLVTLGALKKDKEIPPPP